MDETKTWRISYIILTFLLALALSGFSIQTCRLGQTRYELESVRAELNRASDKQQRIGEIVRGTNEILSESFDTLSGIRSQLKTIRESYEEMEALLYSGDSYSNRINNLDIKE